MSAEVTEGCRGVTPLPVNQDFQPHVERTGTPVTPRHPLAKVQVTALHEVTPSTAKARFRPTRRSLH